MTKKFALVSTILWLAFSSLVSAQVPERTKPAQPTQECLDNPFKKITDCAEPSALQVKPTLAVTEETQPCWDDLSKNRTSEEKIDCYMQFIKEIDRQLHANQPTEGLKLAGVRFLQTLGYSDQVAAERVAGHFARLKASIGPVTSTQSQQVLAPAVTARPVAQLIPRVVVEETPEQEENRKLREKITNLEALTSRDKMIQLRAAEIDLQQKIKTEQRRLQKNKDEDSSARQAREEMEEREKAEREMQQRIIDARSMAKVEGCGDPTFSFTPPENLPDTQMWVDVRAASFPRSKYRMFTGAKYFRQYMQIRIINPVRGPAVDIEWNDRAFRGVVVKNLCPGGRVTLMREREPMVDDSMVTVQIQVIRHDGRVMYPQQYMMSSWDYQRGTFPIYQIPNW